MYKQVATILQYDFSANQIELFGFTQCNLTTNGYQHVATATVIIDGAKLEANTFFVQNLP